MLRTFINTYLALLLLLTFLFLLLPFKAVAADCPIGDTPTLKWPLGTAYIASACVNNCRAVEGFEGSNTWTCSNDTGYCTGYFTTTGDVCSGSDNSNGTCDANGNCTSTGGGSSNGNGIVNVPWLPTTVESGLTLSKAFDHVVKSLNNQNEYTRREVESFKIQALGAISGLRTSVNTSTDAIVNSSRQVVDIRNESVRQTLEMYKTNDYLVQIVARLASIGGSGDSGKSEEYLKYIADTIKSDFLANSAISTSHLNFLGSITTFIQQDLNKLVKRPPLSLSNVESGINNLNNSIDSLSEGIDSINSNVTGVNSGIQNLNDLISGKGLNKAPINSDINFGDMPLYDSQSLEKLNADITDLQKEYSEKIKDFKKLFSFNLSKLNGGEYKDHSLTFTFANGNRTSITSSVFPALVSNAGIIASVILFLAALAGLRIVMGGGDK